MHRTGRSDLFLKGCALKSKLLLMCYQSNVQHQNIWILLAVPGRGSMSVHAAFKGRRGSCVAFAVGGCTQVSPACHGRAPAAACLNKTLSFPARE